MKKIFAFTVAALALLAVSCNKEVAPEATGHKNAPVATIEKTFNVNAPGATKTALSGATKVVWSEDDAITVIAAGSKNMYTFTLTDGEGTSNAKFSGLIDEADAEETTFYAFYPASIEIDPDDEKRPLSSGNITVKMDCFPPQEIPAVKDGFSAQHAMMVAKTDSNGDFAFHYGTAFFKIKIGNPDVQTINFASSGSARFGGRPSWSTTDFSTTDVQSAKNNVTLVADDVLEEGGVYYIPVQTKQSTVKTLTLTFTCSNGFVATKSTTSLNSTILENGKIYDLGCPVVDFTPVIMADNVTLAASARSGEIAYEITNPRTDGTLSAALMEDSDWLTIGSVSEDAVAISVTENTGYARSATVVLTYTYGSESVTKNVTVSQSASAAAGESHVRVFYYDSSKTPHDLIDGEAGGNYFTATATTDLGGDYTITSWAIGDYSSTKGVKMNSSGAVTFTTSASLNSTVQFWFIRRKSGDTTAKIQIVSGETEVAVFDSPYDEIGTSGVVNLEKGTSYTIKQKSKEQALLLVTVNETE